MIPLLLLSLLSIAQKAELIQSLSGSNSDILEVQAGGLVFREGEAGVAFGSVKVGKGKRQFTYFLVVKHDLGKAEKSEFNEEANAEGSGGTTKQILSLDGRKVEVVYSVAIEKGKIVKETLSVNKKEYDLSKGRVFLVDLTATMPKAEQRKADLPATVSAASKKEAAEVAKRVLASLAKQDARTREFIEKAGK